MTVKYEKFLLNGVEYKTQLTQKWVNRKKWEEPKLAAPFSGKIKKIYVNSGDKIPKGTLMIEMEENEAV